MTGAPASAPKAHARILVIEDEPSVAAFLRAALERHGYEVTSSSSAVEGLRLLALHDFRGVISIFARRVESRDRTCMIGWYVTGRRWHRGLFLLRVIPQATKPLRCWHWQALPAWRNHSASSN